MCGTLPKKIETINRIENVRHAFMVPCLLSGDKRIPRVRGQTHDVVVVAISVATTYDDRHGSKRWKDSNERSEPYCRDPKPQCTSVHGGGLTTCDVGHVGVKRKESNTVVASGASIDWSLISSHNANHSRYKPRVRVLHVLRCAA